MRKGAVVTVLAVSRVLAQTELGLVPLHVVQALDVAEGHRAHFATRAVGVRVDFAEIGPISDLGASFVHVAVVVIALLHVVPYFIQACLAFELAKTQMLHVPKLVLTRVKV